MARPILIVLLTLGAAGGFFSAFHHRHSDRRDTWERHVADLCTDAVLRAQTKAIEKR
jgi:hypothetical protein